MKSAKNMIDNFFLDFTFKANGRDKPQATEETRSFFYDNLLPKIDSLLSKYSGNTSIRIDSLTIDLDKISLNDLPDRLLVELEAELDKQTENTLSARSRSENAAQKQANDIEALVYFLKTGSLPWHHNKALHPEKLLTAIFKKQKQRAIDKLRQLFKTNETALERFVLQFSDRQVEDAFTAFIAESNFNPILVTWHQFVAKRPEHLVKAFHFVIKHEALKNETPFLDAFAEKVMLPYLNADQSVLPKIIAELKTSSGTGLAQSNKLLTLFKTLEKKYGNKKLASSSNDQPSQTTTDPQTEKGKDTPEHSKMDKADASSVAVDNAGLVILFPYLQMFFNEIGLVKEEQFVSKASRLKAVQILQYLATGSLKTPEHLLALNKILCGVDPAMPCPGRLRLTKEQKESCDVLLNAVITNWPPLKNTSIDGFRRSFLQRNGTLKKDDDNWILHVEKKGIDILLEELPWGFSVVKFPWNEYFVHTQW